MAALFVVPFNSNAQTKQTALKTAQINERTSKGDGLIFNKYLLKKGYVKGKTLHAQRYDLKDKAGAFNVTVIAIEYTKTLPGQANITAEYSYIEIQRGDTKQVFNVVEDDEKTYQVKEGSVVAKGPGCDPKTVAVALISASNSCKNCVDKVKSCIDSNKGKVWKTTVCLVNNATIPCIPCVVNVAKLISAIIACV